MPDTEQREDIKPEVGRDFVDRFSEDGYGWRVLAVDEGSGIVHLRGTLGGELTEATFDWPLNRWHMLFEAKGMLG